MGVTKDDTLNLCFLCLGEWSVCEAGTCYPTLFNPMDCGRTGSSVHDGVSLGKKLGGLPFLIQGGSEMGKVSLVPIWLQAGIRRGHSLGMGPCEPVQASVPGSRAQVKGGTGVGLGFCAIGWEPPDS